jgi:hypothetical protein
MKNILYGFICFSLSACGNGGDDTGDSLDPVLLEIVSPEEGSSFMADTEVDLLATGAYEVSGESVDLSALVWTNTAGDWSATGPDLIVTDLPIGETVLTASIEVNGRVLSDRVAITIETAPAEPVDLVGPFNGYVELYIEEYNITVDDDCIGTVSVTVGADNSVVGSIHCEALGESVDLDVNGTVAAGEVHGVFSFEDSEETVPFDGTYSEGAGMWAEYDSSFSNEDGRLSISGDLNAYAGE